MPRKPLKGAAKKAFLERMARGRRKASRQKRGNPRPRAARPKAKKTGKLTGARKQAFLERMARGRRLARRGNPKKAAARRRTSPATVVGMSGKQKEAWLRKMRNGRRRRRNSELGGAERMYETFHQKRPGEILEYDQQLQYRQDFAQLGRLMELRFDLDSANRDFPLLRFGDCQVVCTPDGQNIYFVGGDQAIDLESLNIASSKDQIELGPCTYIKYHTVKGFHDFTPTDYYHRFGEEDRIYPTLMYDRLNKSLYLTSGNYRVEREGIRN